jgi:hypothetical protein
VAVKRNTYAPGVENVALLVVFEAAANVTLPGPLTFVHDTVGLADCGSPSSCMSPLRVVGSSMRVVIS